LTLARLCSEDPLHPAAAPNYSLFPSLFLAKKSHKAIICIPGLCGKGNWSEAGESSKEPLWWSDLGMANIYPKTNTLY